MMDKTSHQAFFDEEDPEATDKEWEEFAKLLGKKKKRQTQTFYPSPPPEDDYISTLMYGQYSKQLGEFAKLEALKSAEKRRQKEEKARKRELRGYQGKFAKTVSFIWKHTFARLGEDWVFLAVLGFIMAVLSFLMDGGISICNQAKIWLYYDLTQHPAAQYAAWVSLSVCLVLFSAGFAHLVAPQSIVGILFMVLQGHAPTKGVSPGKTVMYSCFRPICLRSGIPEMKTILTGVSLKEYLTFRTLVAKVVGLTATLGSGLPLGKEGPFVHIASITATLLSKLVTGFQGIYENESRTTEMLAAACAVGVASCFAAPVGGVLFSIEVTTVYFAVRNYWRGFFAAVCGATTFRLLAVWFQSADTVTAVFKTNFYMDIPFDPQELFVFALIGAFCGLSGAFYVWLHRQYVIFMGKSRLIKGFLQVNRFLYPGVISLIVSTLTFPLWTGQFIAGDLTTHQQVVALFSNFTWTKNNLTVYEVNTVKHWETAYTGVLINLTCYTVFTFILSIVCMTIPIPSGSFIPVFKIGAGIGRIVGELMHIWFPTGMKYGGQVAKIIPGGYATVGAAAFSGAVTHTISVSVIVFEMTGQITHIIPIMIAVLMSNAVASLLGPSLYDSIILIKKLPYLPDLLPSSSGMYKVFVEDFMFRDVKFIFHGMTYEQVKHLLKDNRRMQSFPLVENPESMVLLGSIQRRQLIQLIEKQIGRERRLEVAAIRKRRAEEKAKEALQKKVEEWSKWNHRFQVVPAPDVLHRQMSENHLNYQPTYNPVFGTQPKKSILKKTNSFTLKGCTPFVNTSPGSTPYTTITGAESRIRSAFEAIFRKSAQLQDVDGDSQTRTRSGSLDSKGLDLGHPILPNKKVQLPKERVIDMSAEDQRKWEEEQMQLPIDFSTCHIDPAPFQLVGRTSLLKVHSLFSMVGVKMAYVTAIGKLVGVVGLKELRTAIENANSGNLPSQTIEASSNNTLDNTKTPGSSESNVSNALIVSNV